MRRILYLGDQYHNTGLPLVKGIARYGRLNGYWDIAIHSVTGVSDLRQPVSGQYDGVIVKSPGSQLLRRLGRLSLPTVQINAQEPHPRVPSIEVDHVAVGQTAADFLLSAAFPRFAYYGFEHHASHQRLNGFVQELHKRGRECFSNTEQGRTPDWEEALLPSAIARFLQSLTPPTAVLCFNDEIAAAFIRSCVEAKLAVPDDIAVLGVDDNEVFCLNSPVPVSSVEVDMETAGFQGAAILDALLAGRPPDAALLTVRPGSVVRRRSTDTMAVSDPDLLAAVKYIRAHATGGITVSDVLKQVPMSRRTLERRFKEVFGHLPGDEIRVARLRVACDLLTGTHLSLTAVAHRAGFFDASHFSREFKRRYGVTPLSYRQASILVS